MLGFGTEDTRARVSSSSQLECSVRKQQGVDAQTADLLHLLDAARSLYNALVLAALGQLLQDGRLLVHPRANDEREPEALLVFLVQPRHARGFQGAQRVHASLSLLLKRLSGQGAAFEIPSSKIRVAPEDPLFTWTHYHSLTSVCFISKPTIICATVRKIWSESHTKIYIYNIYIHAQSIFSSYLILGEHQ